MSNCAMSNETDRDWLARNVHVWPYELQTHCYVMAGSGGKKEISASAYSPFFSKLTKEQWLARRAELQNKPSWKDAPEWAEWLAQDEDGVWWYFSTKPKCQSRSFDEMGSGICADFAGAGEVLGDWRDTLEKRPEEFQPSTSIEDNQEKAMKQDNVWHERGELPPVGVECETLAEPELQWVAAEVVAHRDGFAIVWVTSEKCGAQCDNPKHFRPIRTERDDLVDVLTKAGISSYAHLVADAILAAGYRKESK